MTPPVQTVAGEPMSQVDRLLRHAREQPRGWPGRKARRTGAANTALGATEWRLLAALDPDVLALDLAGVPYRHARRVGVHRIGQLTKPDLLVVQLHRHTTLARAGQTPRTRTGLEVLAAGHDGHLR